MIFLDPTSDMGFKKLFANAAHKDILISFLNSVLERVEGSKIVDVIMNDPSNIPETVKAKASIVDVRCSDQKGHQFIIEMQVNQQQYYAARAQYYSSIALSRQLATKERYEQLVPVIFIGVLDFTLFANNPHYITHHFILDNQTHSHELKHLEFHFIELTKFDKKVDELTTVIDKWIYFLKNASTLQRIPSSLKEPEFQEAFDLLEQGNWSKGELEAYDRYLDDTRSYEGQIEYAQIKGKQEGKLEEKIEIAQQLLKLKVLDDEAIAKTTGLSLKKVEELKKQVHG